MAKLKITDYIDKLAQAKWLLRIGLAIVFLYAAVDATLQPQAWIGYLPPQATQLLPAALALKLFAFFQLVIAVWLLSTKKTRYAALVVALTMIAIIATNIQAWNVTFRDVAILFAALALARLA